MSTGVIELIRPVSFLSFPSPLPSISSLTSSTLLIPSCCHSLIVCFSLSFPSFMFLLSFTHSLTPSVFLLYLPPLLRPSCSHSTVIATFPLQSSSSLLFLLSFIRSTFFRLSSLCLSPFFLPFCGHPPVITAFYSPLVFLHHLPPSSISFPLPSPPVSLFYHCILVFSFLFSLHNTSSSSPSFSSPSIATVSSCFLTHREEFIMHVLINHFISPFSKQMLLN